VKKRDASSTGKFVVFTDLDGTLLTSSFEKAMPALEAVHELRIPIVFVSSKTRAEIEVYRKRLDNGHPFVFETGGESIFLRDTFPFMGSAISRAGMRSYLWAHAMKRYENGS
jgi:predicted mannosyl-3-phosphoglycerate phosphatase (HAD superfamily)